MTKDVLMEMDDLALADQLEAVARTFVDLADTLVQDFDPFDFLHLLTRRCVSLLDVDQAGLLLAGPDGELRLMAASHEATRTLELLQLQAREGPCLDCFATGTQVISHDLTTDVHRWPRFAPAAIRMGYRSVVAIPMRLRDEVIGALNLFRNQPTALPKDERSIGQAMADIATIGLIQERAQQQSHLLADQLQHALDSRVLIEQAKGIVAEQSGVDMDEAFDRIRRFARFRRRRVRAVAEDILAGTLDATDLSAVLAEQDN